MICDPRLDLQINSASGSLEHNWSTVENLCSNTTQETKKALNNQGLKRVALVGVT